jgi:hypothetical protein
MSRDNLTAPTDVPISTATNAAKPILTPAIIRGGYLGAEKGLG